ncbi:hypothetical protein [Capybara microvirus Cap1_SP_66]|nr:hypothetical protein [Capybara microvirus Cap1_SP_66]
MAKKTFFSVNVTMVDDFHRLICTYVEERFTTFEHAFLWINDFLSKHDMEKVEYNPFTRAWSYKGRFVLSRPEEMAFSEGLKPIDVYHDLSLNIYKYDL